MNWNVPFIGGDANNNPALAKAAGNEAVAQFMFLSPRVAQDLDAPEAKAFVAAYHARYGESPMSIWAVLAGDAFRVIVAAIAGAGSTDGTAIGKYLHQRMRNFPGYSGPITFDDAGDRKSEVYRIYQMDAHGTAVLLN